MSEHRGEIRIPPWRQSPVAAKDLSILVRVPHDRDMYRAFLPSETAQASTWAAEHGGVCEPLPLADGPWDWETGAMRTQVRSVERGD
ncbi:Uncharacterised protein [Mycobacteroides abscessus subsp. abscessus]|uniref:hypothetical protein n=1 Tax=Mycobacteroides abscessus TaxID=36809 RepID=UPI000928BFF7|nr:hypothetical protein [Mycobacteroides abscessus]SIH57817.1 Uncharacterised protein [Mycobacteroides abscessus subsp. abscessus]